jgi:hypothetical protein
MTAELQSISVIPPVAGLAYSHLLPSGWQQVPIPEEEPDFSQPVFLPLGVNMAPYGAVLFTVAARPAFEDGSVYEWLLYLCQREQLEVRGAMPVRVAGRDMVECRATQQTDAGPMRLRLLMFEDGGRLFQISAMAPEAIWASLEATFDEMLESLQLDKCHGPTVPLIPGMQARAGQSMETPAAPAAKAEPDFTTESDKRESTLADFSLAADAASLDQNHPTNRVLLENGIGFTPPIVSIHQELRYCCVRASSISADLDVPFGWHAMDDGTRLLIFDAANDVQINFRQMDASQDLIDLAEELTEAMASTQPALQSLKLELGGMPALAFRGIVIDGQALEQVHLFHRTPEHGGAYLHARVTATPETVVRAMNMVELMLAGMSPL